MTKVSMRKGGITFYPNDVFEFKGYKIPESALVQLAEEENITKLVKDSLAIRYLQRQQAHQVSVQRVVKSETR